LRRCRRGAAIRAEEARMTIRRSFIGLAAGLALFAASSAAGAVDIDPALIAKAKAEGQLVFYTNLIIDQIVRPLAQAFEAKYGITVNFTRADSQATILKLVNEARAGRTMADIWNLSSGYKVLRSADIIAPFKAPDAAGLPEQYRDPAGYWIATNLYVLTPGYNTDLVPKGQVPMTFADLLDPKWKGKLVWKPNDVSGAVGFIGNVLQSMGQAGGMAYLKQLAAQDVNLLDMSARAVLDRVIAGEYPIALQIFNTHAVISAKKGAPVDWIRMEPATLTFQFAGLTKSPPHPNAGLLFLDYMVSPEGQKIFQDAGYLPARADVPATVADLTPAGGGFKADLRHRCARR
jgi:ABC-type Fe3+ transport system substrate-binding protein